jgi:methionyl-tRNA formyltransferase
LKVVILTSNSVRHKFLANRISQEAKDALIISECKPLSSNQKTADPEPVIREHFDYRDKTEQAFFVGNDAFEFPVIPVLHGEANSSYVYNAIRTFNPDLMIVYGASIIRKPLLELLPYGRIINLHLGISPYYRGSGTNFWPFVNNELQFVGSTLLNIDAGVDTGDIIAHVRPKFEEHDNVHTAGNKVIKDSAEALVSIMNKLGNGEVIRSTKQWETEPSRYYRKKDFNSSVLETYFEKLNENMVQKYLANIPVVSDLITLM